jgi:hypothetical protein
MNMASAEKVKRKMKKHCKDCEEKTGSKKIDECYKCPWHHFFNENFKKAVGET